MCSFIRCSFLPQKKKSLNASHVISLKRGTGFMVQLCTFQNNFCDLSSVSCFFKQVVDHASPYKVIRQFVQHLESDLHEGFFNYFFDKEAEYDICYFRRKMWVIGMTLELTILLLNPRRIYNFKVLKISNVHPSPPQLAIMFYYITFY